MRMVYPAGVVRVGLWGRIVPVLSGRPAVGENASLAEVVWDGLPERVRVPYAKTCVSAVVRCPSSSGPVESAVNLPGPPGKPEYFLVTDSG